MLIYFYKYQGTGNDFVIIDNRLQKITKDQHTLFQYLCHRRMGIGADGVILLQNHPDYDFEMVYINADGYEGSMCGNGGRCIIAFAQYLGIIQQSTHFIAVDGEHFGKIEGDQFHLKMNKVNQCKKINETDYELDTGSPHYVRLVENLSKVNVLETGRSIRHNDTYNEKGINVNFIETIHDTQLKIGTFERGVEDVTLSCGTGVTAASIVHLLDQQAKDGKYTIDLETQGGNLAVQLEKKGETFDDIWLIGPAVQVFGGTIDGRF